MICKTRNAHGGCYVSPIHMTTPDGAVISFGPSSGWNASAADRLMFLEIAAAHSGDGRYRFAAHRLFNYLLYQHDIMKTHHMLDHFSQLSVAVAYFLSDHQLEPIEPEAGSVLLHHAETLRVRDKEGAMAYLDDLDPDPLKALICCGLICTKRQLPFKLCLRSGTHVTVGGCKVFESGERSDRVE